MSDATRTRSLTLRRAVLAPAAFGTIAVSLVAGVTIAVIYWQQAVSRLEQDMTNTLSSVQQAATGAAWTVDRPAAQLIVQGLMTDRRVSRAGLEADSFQPVERGTAEDRARRFEMRLTHDVRGVDREIGRIYVETDPRVVEMPLLNATIGIGLAMAGIAAVASLWIIWLLQVRVAGPIDILARHAHDLATKPLKDVDPLAIDSVCVVDEIRALGSVLDELRSGNLTTLSELAERRRAELEIQRSKLEALARLSGGVAHEFNNLLQPIATLSELGGSTSGSGPDAERYRQYFDKIHNAAKLATAIASDFLTFCGSTKRPLRVADIGAAVQQATANIAPMAAGVAEIAVEAVPGTYARFDDLGLAQIVVNLVKNAIEAFAAGPIPAKSPRITVAVEAVADGSAILRVSDNGPGMTEAVRARIFEPFFTTKGAAGGTGLGLSVVYGIVTAWGGTIDVTSRPGDGCAFRIQLPAGSEKDLATHDDARPAAA